MRTLKEVAIHLYESHHVTDGDTVERAAAEIGRLTAENERLRAVVGQALEAHDSGNLQFASPEIGEPENGIPIHPWHEEWLHYARMAFQQQAVNSEEGK